MIFLFAPNKGSWPSRKKPEPVVIIIVEDKEEV